MKNVTVCMVCYSVTVDDIPIMNGDNIITRLLLTAKFTPENISIEKYVCHECRIFSPKEFCDKILSAK